MTPDDEAFVRAIVDRPGDDVPRLVYADWLDVRGDPRGAYLRAEAEHPGVAATLAPLAGGLDPVWVARVSRPPVGVCCDRVHFGGERLQLTPGILDWIESKYDAPFASQHRAFLLNVNGGSPQPARIEVSASGAARALELTWFHDIRTWNVLTGMESPAFGFDAAVEPTIRLRPQELRGRAAVRALFPLAFGWPDPATFFVAAGGRGAGAVYVVSDRATPRGAWSGATRVTGSLGELLAAFH